MSSRSDFYRERILLAPRLCPPSRVRLQEVLAGLPTLITLTAPQARSEGHLHHARTLARLAERVMAK